MNAMETFKQLNEGANKWAILIVLVSSFLGFLHDRIIVNDLHAVDDLIKWKSDHQDWAEEEAELVREDLRIIKSQYCFDTSLSTKELVYLKLATFCDSVKANYQRN